MNKIFNIIKVLLFLSLIGFSVLSIAGIIKGNEFMIECAIGCIIVVIFIIKANKILEDEVEEEQMEDYW